METLEIAVHPMQHICRLRLVLERVEKFDTILELWLYLDLPANRKAAARMLKKTASALEKSGNSLRWSSSEEEISFDVEQEGPQTFTTRHWGQYTIWSYGVLARPSGQDKSPKEERWVDAFHSKKTVEELAPDFCVMPASDGSSQEDFYTLKVGSYEEAHQYIADFDEEAAAALADTLEETLAGEEVA